MVLYAVAFIAALILCHTCTTECTLLNGVSARRFRNARIAFLALLPLTFITVCRWDVGVDTIYGYNYWDSFQQAEKLNNVRNFETGFFLYTALLSKLGLSYWGYLAITALVFMSCTCYAISKGSVWPVWSVLVFFLFFIFFDSFNTLRQTTAEAISMVAWAKMGHDKKSMKKDISILLIFLLASTFHSLALLNIPIYFICKFRFRRIDLLLFAALVILATPAIQALLSYVMKLFAGDEYEFMGFALINAFVSGVIFLMCWFFYDNIAASGTYSYTYANLSLCIFIVILNSGALYLPFRFFDMMKIGYMFIIPYLLRGLKTPKIRFIMQNAVLLILLAWFYNSFFLQDSAYIPYQTIFKSFVAIVTAP